MTIDELMTKIKRYQAFSRFSGGGLTVSGGEPMAQSAFVAALFERAGEAGIHRALDTSGTLDKWAAEAVLRQTDLLILDVKSTDAERYHSITKVSSERFAVMMKEAAKRNVPTWLRLVVVPGLTDGQEEIEGLRRLKERYPNISKIELLPFHKMGEHKWEELGIDYDLADTPAMSVEVTERMQQALMNDRHHTG
jgi:pyruvate formate lyase activating enzyme